MRSDLAENPRAGDVLRRDRDTLQSRAAPAGDDVREQGVRHQVGDPGRHDLLAFLHSDLKPPCVANLSSASVRRGTPPMRRSATRHGAQAWPFHACSGAYPTRCLGIENPRDRECWSTRVRPRAWANLRGRSDMNDGTERWLSVVGWEGYYEVSGLGRVRSATPGGGAMAGGSEAGSCARGSARRRAITASLSAGLGSTRTSTFTGSCWALHRPVPRGHGSAPSGTGTRQPADLPALGHARARNMLDTVGHGTHHYSAQDTLRSTSMSTRRRTRASQVAPGMRAARRGLGSAQCPVPGVHRDGATATARQALRATAMATPERRPAAAQVGCASATSTQERWKATKNPYLDM